MPDWDISLGAMFGPAPSKIHLDDRPCMRRAHGEKAGIGCPPSSSMKLARASVGEGPKDCAGVLVHDLTKVHGDGE